ncbi:MAG: SDR family oxidoreductase [Terriglobia bacterium]
MANRLKDKVAIVTGGGSGIGRAIAVSFAREGARVAICGRTMETLDDTAGLIRGEAGHAISIRCDVSRADHVQAMVDRTVAEFGQLDILVNNAGVRGSIKTILELDEQEWQRTFDIDAKGSWLCSRSAIPYMMKSGGSIIMVSSISAHLGQIQQGCYNAAKAAQELLMKCMALDFAPHGIRVNSICPAWVRTEMNREQLAEMAAQPEKLYPPGLTYEEVLKLHPLGRLGTPEDCASAAIYLASDESRWVTGSSLILDGGYSAR